eukprot:GILK01012064.1.p1 GENE.GILK01012064.1~~GILK01012064.1.p1  ORF type:complete len:308 (-),score=57.25 GILK01012064.1:108-1001(-)
MADNASHSLFSIPSGMPPAVGTQHLQPMYGSMVSQVPVDMGQQMAGIPGTIAAPDMTQYSQHLLPMGSSVEQAGSSGAGPLLKCGCCKNTLSHLEKDDIIKHLTECLKSQKKVAQAARVKRKTILNLKTRITTVATKYPDVSFLCVAYKVKQKRQSKNDFTVATGVFKEAPHHDFALREVLDRYAKCAAEGHCPSAEELSGAQQLDMLEFKPAEMGGESTMKLNMKDPDKTIQTLRRELDKAVKSKDKCKADVETLQKVNEKLRQELSALRHELRRPQSGSDKEDAANSAQKRQRVR